MLTSNRFTNSLTKVTANRLKRVLDNSRPMTRRERNRGAVVAVQAALSDLNKGYLASAQVDGFYGRMTAGAVEIFQRDYGLFADSIVGRQTLLELDQLFSSDLFRSPQGMSIHVGVNRVDPDHYGDPYPLTACVNDARAFRDLAVSLDFNDILLINEDATTENFASAIRQAGNNLFSGDSLFITFSGHGSQTINDHPDEEIDLMDETLCFYDRMLIDDENYALLSELRPGVQVTVLYDSCHSGTVTKMLVAGNENEDKWQKNLFISSLEPVDPDAEEGSNSNDNRFIPFESGLIEKALDGDNAPVIKNAVKVDPKKIDEVVRLIIETENEEQKGKAKRIESFSNVYDRNISLYKAVKSAVGSREQEQLECTVIALSACQDNQVTLDGSVHGLFTGNVLSVWGDGGFNGSYKQLHSRLVSKSVPSITPVINTYGGNRAKARLNERPFFF